MILAGDIGGTKTVLSLLTQDSEGLLSCLKEQSYPSQQYSKFDEILNDFLSEGQEIASACFGIAGPVVNQRCQTTNLPWLLDGNELKARLNTSKVKLLNDLEAMALGMKYLPDDDLVELNPNAIPQTGNVAVIAAGTGLGEAILFWDGITYHPLATEGGHTDFAAQNELQDQLLKYLRKKNPEHVSYERILAGVGFSNLYDFLCEEGLGDPCTEVSELTIDQDRNAVISRLGVTGEDPCCVQVVRLFVEIYGAETGNLALKSLSMGGVYIGGGIGPKILIALQEGSFIAAFKAKGRFLPLLDTLSVKLSVNPRTPLIGAIHYYL